MTKAQVHDLIGSPSVIDPFHNNQWDYINHSTLHGQDNIYHRLVLNFSRGELFSIDNSGIRGLAALSGKEKSLEERRLAEEIAANNTRIKAKRDAQKAQNNREEEVAIALEVKRFVNEQKDAVEAKKAKIIADRKAIADAIIKDRAEAKALKIFKQKQALKNKLLAEQLRKEDEKAQAKKLRLKQLAKEKALKVLKSKTLEYKRLAEEEAQEALRIQTLEYKRLAEEEAKALKIAEIAEAALDKAERAKEATEEKIEDAEDSGITEITESIENIENAESPWYKFW
jgi:outer membrane protein assembly factor BamE (lipoprotein component of BamABCDE complex)